MPLTKWDIAFLLCVTALQAVLVTVMLRRRLQKRSPLFFIYCCYSVTALPTLTVAALTLDYGVFFKVNFVCQLTYVALGLLAMNEAFNQVFSLYYSGRKWFRLLLPGVVLLVMAISMWKWFQHVPAKNETLWAEGIRVLQHCGDAGRTAAFRFRNKNEFFLCSCPTCGIYSGMSDLAGGIPRARA